MGAFLIRAGFTQQSAAWRKMASVLLSPTLPPTITSDIMRLQFPEFFSVDNGAGAGPEAEVPDLNPRSGTESGEILFPPFLDRS